MLTRYPRSSWSLIGYLGVLLISSVCGDVVTPSPHCNLTAILESEVIQSVNCDAEELSIYFSPDFASHSCLASTNFTVGGEGILNGSCTQRIVPVNLATIYVDIDDCVIAKTTTTEDLIFELEFDIDFGNEVSVSGLIVSDNRGTAKWTTTCTFDRIKEVNSNYTVSSSFLPPAEIQDNSAVTQEFKLKMEVFSTGQYITVLPYPVSKPYLEDLYFQISFDDSQLAGQSDNFYLVTDWCKAKDTNGNFDNLITDECVADDMNSIVEIPDRALTDSMDRWQSRVFRFPNENEVYIECGVRICYNPEDCERDCSKQLERSSELFGGKNLDTGNTFEQTVSTGLIGIKNEVAEDSDKSAGVTACYALFLIFVAAFSM
jgi:hypothetical protein